MHPFATENWSRSYSLRMWAKIPETRLPGLVAVLVKGIEGAHDVAADFDRPFKRQHFIASVDQYPEVNTARGAHGAFERTNQAQPLEGALNVSLVLLHLRQKHVRFLAG